MINFQEFSETVSEIQVLSEKSPPGYEKVIEKAAEKDPQKKGMLIGHYWNILNKLIKDNPKEFEGMFDWVENSKGENRIKIKPTHWDTVSKIVKKLNSQNKKKETE